MAALVHTITSHNPLGENAVITGEVVVTDANKNHVALLPTTGYVHTFQVHAGEELATDPLIIPNANTAIEETLGSVLIETSDACKLYFTAVVAAGPY